ncbi:DUF4974 domain-containing protein [Solitalea sp. MAHUQ-68]|uniref:DUF4974 domain-containing protein n=1 Tax=Solitalea agri TaxID=2953739 RepID=A0A9X2F4V3_9SPHI|nr:FecR domain-containing protein [Solitalea agri]MCO4294229.1 DUF4974 domain-containing protein [Solitalea agri]
MTRQEAQQLFEKYNKGLASAEEQMLLEQWYHHEQANQRLTEEEASFILLKDEIWEGTLAKAGLEPANIEHASGTKTISLKKWLAAACIVLPLMIAGGYFLTRKSIITKSDLAANKENTIVPGGNKAILTLADGSSIVLNDRKNGVIANQQNAVITKDSEGKISYGSNDAQSVAVINTLSTPKGGTYQVRLPDGTQVWLNAATKLSYPSSFAGANHRTVELTGEAYFEVAKDKTHPFIVKSGTQEVEVLGTHFNVNSYTDESAVKTTLLEGSVKVSANGNAHLLKPGQQSVLTATNAEVITANIKETMAWKNGYFRFNEERIDEIMLKLSRWYDVEVSYAGKISDERFSGNISRYKNINEVLDMLSYSNAVKFKVEGRRVTVME